MRIYTYPRDRYALHVETRPRRAGTHPRNPRAESYLENRLIPVWGAAPTDTAGDFSYRESADALPNIDLGGCRSRPKFFRGYRGQKDKAHARNSGS